jgi:hypothetical protein
MTKSSVNRQQRRANTQQHRSTRQQQWWAFKHLDPAELETAIYAITALSVIAGSTPIHCPCCNTSAIWQVDELRIETSWNNTGGVSIHHHWNGDSRSQRAESALAALIGFLNDGGAVRLPEIGDTIN